MASTRKGWMEQRFWECWLGSVSDSWREKGQGGVKLYINQQTLVAAVVVAGAHSQHYQSRLLMKLLQPHSLWVQGGFACRVENSPERSALSAPLHRSSQWGHSPAGEPSRWRAPAFPRAPSADPAFCGPDWERCCWRRRRLRKWVASLGTPGPTCKAQTPQSSGSETGHPTSQWRPLRSTGKTGSKSDLKKEKEISTMDVIRGLNVTSR